MYFWICNGLPKLKQEDVNHLSTSIASNEIEAVIKSFPTKKSPGLEKFTAEFCQMFKELIAIPLKLFHKIERTGTLPNSFYEVSITLTQKPN
jgi:hypothetical protein